MQSLEDDDWPLISTVPEPCDVSSHPLARIARGIASEARDAFVAISRAAYSSKLRSKEALGVGLG